MLPLPSSDLERSARGVDHLSDVPVAVGRGLAVGFAGFRSVTAGSFSWPQDRMAHRQRSRKSCRWPNVRGGDYEMPRIENTIDRAANGTADESTATNAWPSITVDRHRIRSLLATVHPADSKGTPHGIDGNENGTFAHSESQSYPWSPNDKSFSLFPPRVVRIPTATLHPTQEWEGRVIKIERNEFEACLLDLTDGSDVDREVATIPLQEVSAEDRALMKVGSIFRWVIGHERSVGGTRRHVSQIVFLDPPRLTERDLRKGSEWAEWLREAWDAE